MREGCVGRRRTFKTPPYKTLVLPPKFNAMAPCSPGTLTLPPRSTSQQTPDVIFFRRLLAPRGERWGWLGFAGILHDNDTTYQHLRTQRSLLIVHRLVLINLVQFGSLVVVLLPMGVCLLQLLSTPFHAKTFRLTTLLPYPSNVSLYTNLIRCSDSAGRTHACPYLSQTLSPAR